MASGRPVARHSCRLVACVLKRIAGESYLMYIIEEDPVDALSPPPWYGGSAR